jgi:hypothetical protein
VFSLVDRETERDLADRIDPAELERHLDAFEGLRRYPGSEDERTAATYVIDRLEEYGVDATLHEHEAYVSVPESARLTVTAPTRRVVDEAITVAFSASTPPAGVDAEVIAVEDPAAVDTARTRGCHLLVDGPPNSGLVRAAEASEAAGLICRSPNEHLYEGIVSPVWGTPTTETAADLPDLPVVEVTREAGEWLRDRAAGDPVTATIETQTTTEVRTLPCPVGSIAGAESDRYALVGNHVDSWHEGVTDNATAMAVSLELARIVAAGEPPRRGVTFGFWAGHSTGRYAGSAWYADEHRPDLRENGVAYLHLDLNGLAGAEELWYQQMAELDAEAFDAMDAATTLPLQDAEADYIGTTGRPGRNSDQSFWGAGLSSLLSGARHTPGTETGGPIGGGWWWHTPADTRDKVDPELLVEETRLYLALIARLCHSPVLPHDYRETVAELRADLADVEAAADGAVAFDGLHDRLDDLAASLDGAYAAVDGTDDEALLRAAEELQVRLGNALVPALYVGGDPVEHEPALPDHDRLPDLRPAERLPALAGREEQFVRTELRRARARVAEALDRAIRHADRFRADWA